MLQKIDLKDLPKILEERHLKTIKIGDSNVVLFCKFLHKDYKEITTDEFIQMLKQKNLGVYKDTDKDWLKIMKVRENNET